MLSITFMQHVPDLWGNFPDWVIAATAVLGTFFAVKQLQTVAKSSGDQVNVARANLMLEIDERFESTEMLESRLAIRTLRNHCEKAARTNQPNADDHQLFDESCKLFSLELNKLHTSFKTADPTPAHPISMSYLADDASGNRYFTFMRLPYWMETVASLTRDGLLPEDDVLSLYDAVFAGTLACFVGHIKYRTKEPPYNDRLLEHSLWLKGKAEEREKNARQAASNAIKTKRRGLFISSVNDAHGK